MDESHQTQIEEQLANLYSEMMRKKVDYTDELERVNEIEAKLKKKSVSMNAGKYTTV